MLYFLHVEISLTSRHYGLEQFQVYRKFEQIVQTISINWGKLDMREQINCITP